MIRPQPRLFDDTMALTCAGDNFHTTLSSAMKPVVDFYAEAGYDLRDIQLILAMAANEVALDMLLDRRPSLAKDLDDDSKHGESSKPIGPIGFARAGGQENKE